MSLGLQELNDEILQNKVEDDEKFNKTVNLAVKTLVDGILDHSPIFKRYYHKVGSRLL